MTEVQANKHTDMLYSAKQSWDFTVRRLDASCLILMGGVFVWMVCFIINIFA